MSNSGEEERVEICLCRDVKKRDERTGEREERGKAKGSSTQIPGPAWQTNKMLLSSDGEL